MIARRQPDLPPHVLLAARLLAVVGISRLAPWTVNDPFLPFWPIFDAAPAGLVPFSCAAAGAGGTLLLFLTSRARAGCLLLGAASLTAALGSKLYYSNGKLFWAYAMLLMGLYTPERGPLMLRLQFAVMYAGCGLNKALDADWWSGQCFDNWLTVRTPSPVYAAAAALLPPLWTAKLLSWGVIALELGAGAMYASERRLRAAVWTTVLLHAGILVFLGGETFESFFFYVLVMLLAFAGGPVPLLEAYPPLAFAAVLAAQRVEALTVPLTLAALFCALPALADWRDGWLPRARRPEAGPIILYDGVCGLCDRFVAFVLRRDAAGEFRFAALQGGFAGRALRARGLDPAALDTVYVVVDPGTPHERLLSKSRAVFFVLSRLGPGWKLLAAAAAMPAPLRDACYDLIAARRYRLFGKSDSCIIPEPRWKSRFLLS